MPNHCRLPGCRRPVTKHSEICDAHRKNKRRHGHPLQVPVSAFELRRYTRHIRRLINGRSNAEAIWSSLIAAFELLVRDAAAEVHRVKEAKGIARRSAFEADYAILTVSREAQVEDVVVTLVALGYLASANTKRFISDDAYFATMAMRFRRLAPSSFNPIMSPTTGKVIRVSREFSPRAQQLLGQKLAASFAVVGMKLFEIESKELRRAEEVKKAPLAVLSEGLAG